MEMCCFVYNLASKRNGTLYVGVTNNLARRMSEHKAKLVPGFTRQYGVDLLVYFERRAVGPGSAAHRQEALRRVRDTRIGKSQKKKPRTCRGFGSFARSE